MVHELRADAALDVALPVALGAMSSRSPRPTAPAVAPRVAALVDAGTLRAQALFEGCHVLLLDEAALLADPALAAADPGWSRCVNVNTPEEYQEARARLAPTVPVRCFGALATGVDQGRGRCGRPRCTPPRAAVGLALDGSVVAVVDEARRAGPDRSTAVPATVRPAAS